MLAASGGAAPAGAARLCLLQPPLAPRVLVLEAGRTLLWNGGEGGRPLPVRLQAAVQVGDQLYGFADRSAVSVTAEGGVSPLAQLAAPVRVAVPLDQRRALLLLGGVYEQGRLQGALTAIWEPLEGRLRRVESVYPRYNPVDLKVGRAGLRQFALIAVYKPAVFDPIARLRPFLYALKGEKLRPLWKGTSFARPFTAAVMADVIAGGGEEMCALEDLPQGRRVVSAYHWTGAMAELVGQGAAGFLGVQLEQAEWGGAGGLVVFEKQAGRCRAICLQEGNSPGEAGVSMLSVAAATAWRADTPAAWAVQRGAAEPPGLVTLERDGTLRWAEFRAVDG